MSGAGAIEDRLLKRATKAALLSGLVFPGVGHLVLKHYVRGSILMLGSLAALWILVSVTVERAQSIVDRIVGGEIPMDAGAITQAVTDSSQGPDSLMSNAAFIVLVACWVIGIIDSYRAGRRLENPWLESGHGKGNDS